LLLLISLLPLAAEDADSELALRRTADQLGRELDGVMDTSKIASDDRRRILRFMAQKLISEREQGRSAARLAAAEAPRTTVIVAPRAGTYRVREVRDDGRLIILDDGSTWRPARPVTWSTEYRVRVERRDGGAWSLGRDGSDEAYDAEPER
jgi:hypothetical protein